MKLYTNDWVEEERCAWEEKVFEVTVPVGGTRDLLGKGVRRRMDIGMRYWKSGWAVQVWGGVRVDEGRQRVAARGRYGARGREGWG